MSNKARERERVISVRKITRELNESMRDWVDRYFEDHGRLPGDRARERRAAQLIRAAREVHGERMRDVGWEDVYVVGALPCGLSIRKVWLRLLEHEKLFSTLPTGMQDHYSECVLDELGRKYGEKVLEWTKRIYWESEYIYLDGEKIENPDCGFNLPTTVNKWT